MIDHIYKCLFPPMLMSSCLCHGGFSASTCFLEFFGQGQQSTGQEAKKRESFYTSFQSLCLYGHLMVVNILISREPTRF